MILIDEDVLLLVTLKSGRSGRIGGGDCRAPLMVTDSKIASSRVAGFLSTCVTTDTSAFANVALNRHSVVEKVNNIIKKCFRNLYFII